MATWKKLVVSGSDISQLNNNAGYISASQVPAGYNSFSTASVNGVNLIAEASGTLTFASSSGQGLTLSGNSGTDTITFGLSAVPNASLANSSVNIGSTTIALGATGSTLEGLTSVTATNFTGTASYATNANQLDGLDSTAFVLNSQTSSMTVSSSLFAINAGTASNAFTASNITPAITNSNNNRVLTDNGGGTINGEANLIFDGSTLTLNGSQTISGDLTVNGTTTTINTANLLVADKFILLSSGSTSANDGGIIIQSAVDGTGFAFLYDQGQARWAYTGSLSGSATTAAPDAFAAMVLDLAVPESTDKAVYQKNGNIKIDGADIYIFS